MGRKIVVGILFTMMLTFTINYDRCHHELWRATQAGPGRIYHLKQGLQVNFRNVARPLTRWWIGFSWEKKRPCLNGFDYATDKDAAREYITRYHLTIAAFLVIFG